MRSAPRHQASPLAVGIALVTVYVVWGSTYLAIAYMVETLPPLLSAGVRYGSAGLILLGLLLVVARLRGARGALERPTAVQWRSAVIVGTLLLFGGNGFVVLSEQPGLLPSGIAAVLVATVPIWMNLFEALLTRRRPSLLAIGGVLAGFVGVLVLLWPVGGSAAVSPIGVGLVLIATVSWASGSIYAQRAPFPRNPWLGTGMEMVGGGAALLVAGTLIGEPLRTDPSGFSVASLVALGYLVAFGSLVAFSAYVWLLRNAPISTVATYAYVNPIVAVILGAWLRSEPLGVRTLLAAVLIIGAVVAMVSGRPRGEVEAEIAEASPDPGATAGACAEEAGDG